MDVMVDGAVFVGSLIAREERPCCTVALSRLEGAMTHEPA